MWQLLAGASPRQDDHARGLEPTSQALIVYCSSNAGGRTETAPATEEGHLHLSTSPCDAPNPSLQGSCQGKRKLCHLPRTRHSPPVAHSFLLYGKRAKSGLKPPTTWLQRASKVTVATGPQRGTATQNLGALRIRSCPRI